MSMTPDERNLLLLLARMMVMVARRVSTIPAGHTRDLQAQIARIEAAEDRAADEEKHLGRG